MKKPTKRKLRIRIPIPKPDRPHTTKKGKKGYSRRKKHTDSKGEEKIDNESD